MPMKSQARGLTVAGPALSLVVVMSACFMTACSPKVRPIRILTAGIKGENNTFNLGPTQEGDCLVFRGDEIIRNAD
jgi:hypothetical protein